MRLRALVLTSTLIVPLSPGCGGDVVTGTGGGAPSSSSASGAGGAEADGGVGAPCVDAGGCAASETCVTSVPGGYCTVLIAECSADPFAPGVCPAASWCVNGISFGAQAGDFCMQKCGGVGDAACRVNEGYQCCPWGDAGVCSFGQACP